MKKIKNGKMLGSIGAALIFMSALLFSIGTGGGILGLKKDGELSPTDKITAMAANKNPQYDEFPDTVKCYYYSDVNQIVDFHDGSSTATTDVATQNVDLTKNHGTAENPYVINTAKQWEAFANDTTNATNKDKVFVLGSDIDFTKPDDTAPQEVKDAYAAFKPVPSLGAKFYGCNRILSNITYDFKSITSGSGLFNNATATAVITDVSLKDVTFTNVYAYAGFICGKSNASILNCHVVGSMSGKAIASCGIGGIVGNVQGNTARVYVYRCSVFVDFNLHCGDHGGVGGICGDADAGAGLSVYDCIVINNYKFHTGTDAWFGGIFDVTEIKSTTMTTHEIENCVAYSNVKDTSTNRRSEASLFEGWGSGVVTVKCKNTYTAGKLTGTRSNANEVHDMFGGLYHHPNVNNCTATADNVNWYAKDPFAQGYASDEAGSRPLNIFVNGGNNVKTNQWNGSTDNTREDMWKAMVKDSAFSTKIWMNKSIINDAYMTNTDVTSTTGFTIETSPVRNPLKVTVKYFNLTTTGETQYEVDGKTDAVEVKAGDTLLKPTTLDENREFVGWTTNKNLTVDTVTENDPFKTMPSNLLGENCLYAVWKAKDDSTALNIIPTGTGMQREESGAYSLEYNGDGSTSGITLSARPEVTGMSDAKFKYQWTKDEEDIKVGGTGDSYQVTNVRDSGKYWVTVTYYSQREPLYFGTLTCADKDKIDVLIKPATLTCTNLEFKPDTEEEAGEHAYSGASYTTANPIPIVTNAKGDKITGTAEWASKVGRFNSEGSVTQERDGKVYEKASIIFTPDASYNGNYGETITFNEVEFEVEFLTFTFYIPDYYEKKLSFNLTYGDSYTYNRIADEFEKLFQPFTSDKQLNGYSPAFIVNKGEPSVKINDYRELNYNGVTTAYSKVTKNYILEVEFIYQTYTVNYDARNGSTDYYKTDKDVGHNMHLESPVDPQNKSKMFLGWYYDVTVEGQAQPVSKQWDFTKDCVTRDLTLYAKWLDADEFAGLTVDCTNDAQFNALEEVNPNYLIVKATFKGTDEETGKEVSRETILSYGGVNGYTITYSKGDGLLHVTSTANNRKTDTITISYSYTMKGNVYTETETQTLTVKPKVLETEKILGPYFKPSTAVYQEGKAQNIKINTNVSNKIPEIEETTYRYYNKGGNLVNADEVIGIAKYTVYADFKVSDDYEAPSLKTTFEIISQPITLKVDWGNTTFTYNGKVQVPTPTFTDPTNNNQKVDPNYHLVDVNGLSIDDAGHAVDLEATNANASGKFYTVSIEFDDHGYTVALNEKTVQFQILKATVKVPKQILAFSYRGESFDLNKLSATECETYFDGFDPAIMKAYLGDTSAIDAGTYNATIRLKNPTCAEWESGGSGDIDLTWEIKQAVLRVSWNGSNEFIFTGSPQGPKINSLYTIYERDKDEVDLENDLLVTGDRNVSEVGDYKIAVALRTDVQWTKNYVLNDTRTRSFSIIPDGVTIIYVSWDPASTLLEYNGATQRPQPILTLGTADGVDMSEEVLSFITFNDEAKGAKYAGDYTAEIKLNAAGSARYYLKGKLSCPYSIIVNKTTGEGEAPTDNTPGGSDNSDGEGDNNRTDTSSLPIWQLIVTGVSAVLLVVCAAKAFTNYSKAKAAKKEAQELASMSYAVNYAFAPLPLLAIEFLGIGETPWTVIACVTLGLFLVAFAAMLLMGKKRKAAELLLRREQARIAEEKEYARAEEQARRDNELKMMFAAMQQGYQQPFQYGDMQNMINSAVSALLPGLQQMQALPPAPSDQNAYNAPQPGYGAQPDYNRSETDELRAQMAQQQAQMAQQQELINKLLQNQAQQPAAAPAPAYNEGYAEAAAADDAAWLGEGDDVVSLEELYGNLSDDAKRCYYEIGSYIMSKPRTSQNDGKYAVLFRYSGKTLFKLCIKEDAPVLYYLAENGEKSELRIVDAAALETAKSIVDAQVRKTDGQ